MNVFDIEMRRRALARRWRVVSGAVPLCIAAGELLYGTLGSILLLSWPRLLQPMFALVVAGIVALRLAQRAWTPAWKGPSPPDGASAAILVGGAGRFLALAWGFAGACAAMGLLLLLAGAGRRHAYFFEGTAALYFVLYYPRRAFFERIVWLKL